MALDQHALEAAKEAALDAWHTAEMQEASELGIAHAVPAAIESYLAALGDGWQPIETANRSLTSGLDFPGIPKAQHSYPIWCRSQGVEPFEASWVRTESGREYWWAWDLEDVVEPDEWLPHQLDRSLPAAPTPPGEKK